MNTKRVLPIQKIILVLILVWGAALRFYDFFTIPFTHDEFSALFRTGFQSFSALIEQGVLVDFHPAGIQVFLTYYGRFFGFEEWVLKLPFTLMGVGCIYLSYKVGKEWFNVRTGLLIAAFIANTQFFIFYSQIARPYIAGLFFGLLAFLYCKRMLYDEDRIDPKNVLGWILSVTLSAYIHYYLLLSLLLFALIQLFFAPSKRRAIFLLSGVSIFLLYLPHLGIFLKQLSKGGIESWLGKPQPDFLLNFGQYLFHYSNYFLPVVGILAVITITLTFARIKITRFWWIAILSFFASFLFGYCYSMQVNAILQYSGLLFTTPLLLGGLFYLISNSRALFAISLVCIIGMGTYSLVKERDHYSMLYDSPYEQVVKETKAQLEKDNLKTLVLLDNRADILSYYVEKYQLKNGDQLIITDNNWSPEMINSWLGQTGARRLIVGHFVSSPYSLMNIAQHYFPKVVERKSYYHGEYYVLEKDKVNSKKEHWSTSLSFSDLENNDTYWADINRESIAYDSTSQSNYFQFHSDAIYGLKVELKDLSPFGSCPSAFIDIKSEISWDIKASDTYIATAAYSGDSLIKWQASPISIFQKASNQKHWVFHSFPLDDLPNMKDMSLRFFFYNPNGNSFKVYGVNANLRIGNPKLYGLYQPI